MFLHMGLGCVSHSTYFHYQRVMHLAMLIPGGDGAGKGWGFDKKIKICIKCSPVGHSKMIKCFKTDAPRGYTKAKHFHNI